MGYGAGFYHEHSRYDRDAHIEILWGNVERGKESQFRIKREDEVDLQGLPYDYESVRIPVVVLVSPAVGFGCSSCGC